MGILTRSRVEWARGWYALNHYVGCGHRCLYCYGRFLLEKRFKLVSDWGRPRLKHNFQEVLSYLRDIRGKVIWLSSATDPYQPIEAETRATRKVLESVLPRNKVVILTKSDLILRDLDVLHKYRDRIRVGFTITSLKKNPWEPYAPEPHRRIRALRIFKEAGFETFVSIEPWIPEITDPIEIICEVEELVDWIIIGRLNYGGSSSRYYAFRLKKLLKYIEHDNVIVKQELRKCLPSHDWSWTLRNLGRWLKWGTRR